MFSEFHTEVRIPDFEWQTGYQKQNLFVGSCFTEHIGRKMETLKYPADINPFGILYNPISISKGLRILLEEKTFTKNDLFLYNGLWHSFYHHSKFSSPEAEKTLENINARLKISTQNLKNAKFLFLTFGTSLVYEHKTSGKIVSNCHKIPEKEFRRFRLTLSEITDEYSRLLKEIWRVNPDVRVILTVSPIRHIKDGAIENQRSKAILLLATETVINEFGTGHCNYFPAYEIMMDELRDYRYYEEDMIHLSTSAINHIWYTFEKALIDEESREISKNIKKITNALNHKPFNRFTKNTFSF